MVTGTVTLLFTDLVDSTLLLQRAGDERAQRVFAGHHKLLKEAVAANGGHEVKWLGDGLMVAFPSAADAVRCAVAMQQAAQRPVAGERLAIRVGLNVGEALREESDYFGTPVVVAKRLCESARGGQILCSAVVAHLLSGRQVFAFRDCGALDLKGIAAPLPACEVVYEVDPTALLAHVPFVGRTVELATLNQKLQALRAGRGALVMLVGEPGIGKTRTAEEFADLAAQAGALVLWGRCYEGEWAPPYGPFAEAIADYSRAAEPEELKRHLGQGAARIARLVPALRERLAQMSEPAPLPPEEERFHLLDAVSHFLIALAGQRPLLFVLDDLHWADKGTLAMLRHIARVALRHRILLLGTYRDVEVDRQHPLSDALSALRREVEYDCIVLKGLDAAAVGTLLETLADQHVNPALVQAISAETEGNPFFLREVLLHLVEEGKLYRADGQWQSRVSSIADLGIPEGVRQVVTRRLSRLSANANQLLTAASAFNGAFRLDVAATVAGLDEAAALDAVDQALATQLLRPSEGADTYDFTHALVRHTLYTELSPSRQLRLHRQIAEALDRLYSHSAPGAGQGEIGEHAAEVAYQYQLSGALPGAERGVAHALAAVERAEAAYAFDEAASFLRTAIQLMPPTDPRRPRFLGRLAQSLIHLSLPLLIVDSSGALVFFNEAAEPILGRRFEETGEIRRGEWSALFQPTRHDGSPVPPEEQPLFVAVQHRRPVHACAWIRGLDGVRRQVEGIALPLLGHGDQFLGAAGIFWEVK
jgi:class 3 adenylate cyclase/PAS domain-containing protein